MTYSFGLRHSFWDDLDECERSALTTVGRQKHFDHGAAIVDRGDASDGVVFIGEGFAKVVTRVPAGPEVVLAIRGPGDLIGELVGIGGGDRCASVDAVGPVDALLVGPDAFSGMLRMYPHAAAALQRTLVNKLREADRDRLAVGVMTVGQRLARLLLMLGRGYRIPVLRGRGLVCLRH